MIYIGVELHRQFCYMTAMDATGQILDQRRVSNETASLHGYLGRWPESVQMAVWALLRHGVCFDEEVFAAM